jgi:hypothetical protein
MTGKRYYLTTIAAWQPHAHRCSQCHFVVLDAPGHGHMRGAADKIDPARVAAILILVLVTADEAAHIALENDPQVEALPHPLARAPISERAAAALAQFGVVSGDDTFTMAEKLARVHPLLKHRVF